MAVFTAIAFFCSAVYLTCAFNAILRMVCGLTQAAREVRGSEKGWDPLVSVYNDCFLAPVNAINEEILQMEIMLEFSLDNHLI